MSSVVIDASEGTGTLLLEPELSEAVEFEVPIDALDAETDILLLLVFDAVVAIGTETLFVKSELGKGKAVAMGCVLTPTPLFICGNWTCGISRVGAAVGPLYLAVAGEMRTKGAKDQCMPPVRNEKHTGSRQTIKTVHLYQRTLLISFIGKSIEYLRKTLIKKGGLPTSQSHSPSRLQLLDRA